MLQITKNDDELLKNYPFLQAIDKLESSKAHEHLHIFSDISIQNILVAEKQHVSNTLEYQITNCSKACFQLVFVKCNI